MEQSKLKQIIKEEIHKVLGENLIKNFLFGKSKTDSTDLSTLQVGQSIKINSPSELNPFNLKLSPSGQATSDQPELKGMVFNYKGTTLTRIK
jgi:hypothetical protein